MNRWKLLELSPEPHRPEILSSTDDSRAILIELPAGEALEEHEVHERAWLVAVGGEVEVTSAAAPDDPVKGGAGLLVEFEPSERHRVEALSDARILLLLTPWPGTGHPGAMSIEQKANVRERAAEANSEGSPG